MGVLPLEFPTGSSADSLGLDGTEIFDISGVEKLNEGITPKTLKVVAKPSEHSNPGKQTVEFEATLRIDTPGEADYFRHGGILHYVLRSLVTA
jgi:aconitate hydratase